MIEELPDNCFPCICKPLCSVRPESEGCNFCQSLLGECAGCIKSVVQAVDQCFQTHGISPGLITCVKDKVESSCITCAEKALCQLFPNLCIINTGPAQLIQSPQYIGNNILLKL